MFKTIKILLSLLFITTLAACNKDSATTEVPKTGIELVAVGPILFGGVLVGDYRDAAIKIYNHGPDSLSTLDLVSKLTPPFYVKSVSQPCYAGSLASGQNCVMSIRFQPTQGGSYSQTFKVGSAELTTSGKGMLGGVITLSDNVWNLGQNIAGTELRKDFIVTNEGDYAVQAPALDLPPEVSVGVYTCGTYLQPHVTCRVEIVARKITAGSKTEIIKFSSGTAGSQSVNLTSQTFPAEPSGIIDFKQPQLVQVVADGTSEYTVITNAIKDQFGNIVSDGTNVRLNPTNCVLLSASPQQTLNGIISFTIRSSTTKGFATVSVLSGEASGFLRAKAVSGQPSGTISVQTYASQILADGNTQIQFKINPLFDQFGNVVEDGTTVYFNLVKAGNTSQSGSGRLAANSAITILGQASALVTSGTTVGNDILQIRAGPVYDGNNNLVSYRASGDFAIEYISGPAAGNIAVIPVTSAIYAVEDSYYESQGTPIRTIVNIGPVKDANQNIVKEGTAVQVTVLGGVNVTNTGQTTATGYTDALGKLSIVVSGNGNRGAISIKVTAGNGGTGTGSVWAYKDETLVFKTTGDNPITLQQRYANSSSLPDRIQLWSDSIDYSGISSADGSTTQDGNGIVVTRKNLIDTATTRVFAVNFPWIRWPSFFTNSLGLFRAPTEVGNPTYPSSSNKYTESLGIKYTDLLNLTAIDYSKTSSIAANLGYYAAVANTANSECDTLGDFICKKNYSKSNYPGMTYLETFDRYLFFGGFNFEIFPDQGNTPAYPPAYVNDANNYFGHVGQRATYFTGLIREGAAATVSSNTGSENPQDIGSYPMSRGLAPFENNGYNLAFTFGGYDATSEGAFNSLNIYNASSGKWSELMPEDDINEEGTAAYPSARQQNGLAYVPELKTLYVIGGLRKYFCSDFQSALVCEQTQTVGQCKWQGGSCQTREGSSGTGWVQGPQIGGSDIWKVNLASLDNPSSTVNPTWERVCGSQKSLTKTGASNPAYRTCNINSNNWHVSPNPAPTPIKPVQTFAIYNKMRKKIYVYYEGKTDVYTIDPFTDTIGTANDGAQTLAPLQQVIYNHKSGKMIGYQRSGAENSSTSRLVVWDTNPGEKIYYKARINVGTGSKIYGQQFIPKVRAFGKTTSSTIPQSDGVTLYIYNFTSSQWDLVQSNILTTQDDLNNTTVLTGNYLGNSLVFNYVSSDGYVELLMSPNGQPSAGGTSYIGIDQIILEGRF